MGEQNNKKPQTKQLAIDRDLMRKLKIIAANNDITMKEAVNTALNDYIGSFDGAGK